MKQKQTMYKIIPLTGSECEFTTGSYPPNQSTARRQRWKRGSHFFLGIVLKIERKIYNY